MEDMDSDSPLIIKAEEFLETRKYSENLTEILTSLDDSESTSDAISAIELIFMEILKRRTMLTSPSQDQNSNASASEYINWLRQSYDESWRKLTNLMSNADVCEQATAAVFKMLGQEGRYPITTPRKGVYYFPEDKLKIILKKCFTTPADFTTIQSQLDEYTNFIDVVYYFWLMCPEQLESIKKTDEKLVSRVLDILQQVPIPSEDELTDFNEELLLCYTKNKTKFKPKYSTLQSSIQRIWHTILNWNCENNNHKKVLILLIENVMPHLEKPILTLDYLMESLNTGGSVSLLALQGIFVLVKDYNLEYPNIYGKLYSFFHPSIFYTKYKSRLYLLANIFLSSTHIPETLVASFAKRFARLCLRAPPQDIIILSAFISNLLIRHPTLRIMIQHPTAKTVNADPFLEGEEDPLKTRAIESSLWELETLQQHVLPKVAKAVSFINKPLSNAECDLTSLVDASYEQIFEKECKKKIQNVSLTFERPESFLMPRTDYFSDRWCFGD